MRLKIKEPQNPKKVSWEVSRFGWETNEINDN